MMRLAILWKRKLALTAGLGLFGVLPYFLIQKNPLFEPRVLPDWSVDALVPHSPWSVLPYYSFFLLIPLVPWLMVRWEDLRRYSWGVGALLAVALSFYLFWPTAVRRPPADDANLLYQWMVTLDAPRNTFPSIHATLAVYAMLGCELLVRGARRPWAWRAGAFAWTLLILYSTLATKQHIVADALAGCVLALTAHCALFGRDAGSGGSRAQAG